MKYAGLTIAISLLFAIGCTDIGPVEIQDDLDFEIADFKQIVISDISNQNHATLTIFSDNPALLDRYDSSTIELIPFYQGDREQAPSAATESLPDKGEMPPDATSAATHVAFRVDSTSLDQGVIGYDLRFNHELAEDRAPQGNEKADWRFYYHYSYADCVDVTRTSFWRRVYTWIYSASTSTSAWTQIGYAELSNGQTISKCDHNSYRLLAKVKTKVASAYNVSFYN